MNSENKIKLINDFCIHLRLGYSRRSFPGGDYDTILKYANELDEVNKTEEGSYQEEIKSSERTGRKCLEKFALKRIKLSPDKLSLNSWLKVMVYLFGGNIDYNKEHKESKTIKVIFNEDEKRKLSDV